MAAARASRRRSLWRILWSDALGPLVGGESFTMAMRRRADPWLRMSRVETHFSRLRASTATDDDNDDARGCPPSRRLIATELHGLLRLVAENPFRLAGPVDVTYPFLDRRLIEFMLASPFDQRVRRGQTRVLHRQALAGILPREIETRATKANLTSAIHYWIDRQWPTVQQLLSDDARILRYGIANVDVLRHHAQLIRAGARPSSGSFLALLAAERWLRHFERCMARGRTSARHHANDGRR
jgi:hypothetical protein